jgi:hypothetical protein
MHKNIVDSIIPTVQQFVDQYKVVLDVFFRDLPKV